MFVSWRNYLAARTAAVPGARPPWLARSGAAEVYFTDAESLRGVYAPADIAFRVGLDLQTQAECQRFGCAIVEFSVPPNVAVPVPYPGVSAGLTVNGAREWIVVGNLELHDSMRVRYVDTTGAGHRAFKLPL